MSVPSDLAPFPVDSQVRVHMFAPSKLEPFPLEVQMGFVFMVVSSALSAAAGSGCLLYIAYSAIKFNGRKWTMETHVHYYFLNLLVFDLLASVGGLLNIKWAMTAAVMEGTICTAQGIFKQLGDVGVALTSLTIGIHTFCVVALHRQSPPKTAIFVVYAIWIFIALLVGISAGIHNGQHYYGNTQYWCWITDRFQPERIALQYFWVWLAALLNILIYVLLALVINGVVAFENGKIYLLQKCERIHSHLTSVIGTQMLCYPLVYIITASPISIVRFMAFNGHEVPFAATAFASILLSSSGIINVVLFKYTRPRLLSNTDHNSPRAALLPAQGMTEV